MYLSVVLPSYNEMPNISAGVLDTVYAYLKTQNYDWELVLSDDGSSDGTLSQLRQFAAGKSRVRVLANAHQGKGPTVVAGLMAAAGDFVLFSDFDQATPITEVEKLLQLAETGYDVVIGSREAKGASRKKEPWYRHLMGRGFNLLVQLFAVGKFKDTQCGFKLFSRRSIHKLCPKIYVYRPSQRSDAFTGAFDVELLYLARKYNYKITESAVRWKYIKTNRVSPLKDSLRMLADIIKIRLADLQGKYA